jgi:hypothetical protein
MFGSIRLSRRWMCSGGSREYSHSSQTGDLDRYKLISGSISLREQRLYRLAYQLGEQFLDMENQLRAIVEKTCGGRQMESASDLKKIEQTATCRLGSMRWVMDQIEGKLKQIRRKLPKNDE